MRMLIFLILIVCMHTASKIFKEADVVKRDTLKQSKIKAPTHEGTIDSLYYFNTLRNGRVRIISISRIKKKITTFRGVKASEIIIKSIVCRSASSNIYPQDPDELFNTCWLTVKEKELLDPKWKPNDPKYYFLRMMRNKAIDWKKRITLCSIDNVPESKVVELHHFKNPNIPCQAFLTEWLEPTTNDDDLLFLKNIITLALYSKEINHAIKSTGISRTAFWRYHKIAKQRLYDDYHASNNNNVSGLTLV